MKKLEMVWAWLVYSSANSTKIATTIKGAIGTTLVAVSLFAGDVNIPLLGDAVNSVVDVSITVLQAAVGLVSAVMLLVGAARKLWTTFKGTNAVINK